MSVYDCNSIFKCTEEKEIIANFNLKYLLKKVFQTQIYNIDVYKCFKSYITIKFLEFLVRICENVAHLKILRLNNMRIEFILENVYYLQRVVFTVDI